MVNSSNMKYCTEQCKNTGQDPGNEVGQDAECVTQRKEIYLSASRMTFSISSSVTRSVSLNA
jgi:hypothetical protein